MEVSLKEEYKGQLGLRFDNTTREFTYVLTYYVYPKYESLVVEIEEGDLLTIRSPDDGSILLHRVVEYDYDTHKNMNLETGTMHQTISMQPVKGILKSVEPNYWFNLFVHGYYADLVKTV
jgi:hypothetical protein